jgi:hypothetical protein
VHPPDPEFTPPGELETPRGSVASSKSAAAAAAPRTRPNLDQRLAHAAYIHRLVVARFAARARPEQPHRVLAVKVGY